MNTALIGFGRIGKIHFMNIVKNKKFKLKYICEKNLSMFNNILHYDILKMYELTITDDIDKIYNDNTVNAIIVCSPTFTHFQIIKRSLENNINVFVENPLSLDLSEIKICYDIAEKKSLRLFVGYNRRFDKNIIKLKRTIEDKSLGKINYITTTSRDYPYPKLDYLKISGGIFHDCAVHDIDYVNWTLGELPKTVYVTGSITEEKDKNNGHLDHVNIIFEYPDNKIVSLNLSRISQSYDQRFEVYGDKGEFIISDYYYKRPKLFPERYLESYEEELEYFYKLIKDIKLDNHVTQKDNVNNHIIADYCQKSFNLKKRLEINYSI